VSSGRYDAALHLLDRQLVDPDGSLVGKVDDLELTERADGRLVLTAVLTGPGALGPRLGGRLGWWLVAVWRRLHPDADPRPGRIDASDIAHIDSAVHLSRRIDPGGFERWVHDEVVHRIPGATHEPR
jgi:hypothetical protein